MQRRRSPAQGENPYGYSVIQNLKDAGCTDELVEEFMTLEDSGDDARQLRLLSGYRRQLLDQLHRDEQQIDCLDYLIFQMQKKNETFIVNGRLSYENDPESNL